MKILLVYCIVLLFFFSSRRRHTRLVSDWSSDVCSSDLFGSRPIRSGLHPISPKLGDTHEGTFFKTLKWSRTWSSETLGERQRLARSARPAFRDGLLGPALGGLDHHLSLLPLFPRFAPASSAFWYFLVQSTN